jgi:hypothetical protein
MQVAAQLSAVEGVGNSNFLLHLSHIGASESESAHIAASEREGSHIGARVLAYERGAASNGSNHSTGAEAAEAGGVNGVEGEPGICEHSLGLQALLVQKYLR